VIAYPSAGCHASVNPFAGKPAGHRDDRNVGAISLPARGSCATSCIPDSPRLEPIASAVSGDDEVSARAITFAVTSKQSATAPQGASRSAGVGSVASNGMQQQGESQTDGDDRGPIRCVKIGANDPD
jgi:hypothetical protein